MDKTRINNKLNLVLEIPDDKGTIYIHSTPISVDIFNQFYLVLSRTFSFIYSKGLHLTAPRIAHLVLKEIAAEEGQLEAVQNGLMNEIIRLSNVISPSDKGYVTNTLSDALSRNMITKEEFEEIKGMLVFFYCVSSVARKELIEPTMKQLTDLWCGQVTYLSFTEYKDSLQKLIEEPVLEKKITSSIAY